jgi:hypothetical protein
MVSAIIEYDSSPAWHFICATIFYVIGIALLVSLYRGRVDNWRGGTPASLATKVLLVMAFFCWGTVSLGSGLGWNFVVAHGDAIDFITLGLLFCAGAYDRFIYWRDY